MSIPIKLSILLWFCLILSSNLSGQTKVWINKRDTADLKIRPIFCSEWMPFCSYSSVQLKNSTVPTLPLQTYQQASMNGDEKGYGYALDQIGAKYLTAKGLNGQGVKIGIIDGGFLDAPEDAALVHLFSNEQVKSYVDYVTPAMTPYAGSKGLDDQHGTDVWRLIGGFSKEFNINYGFATGASFYLARTDHGGYEKRLEEDYLIAALEEMHRQGVRLINISLGYSDGYNQKSENYTPEMMDGQTSLLSRAVDIAHFSKNILVVVSAGNEGSRKNWKVLSAPADAKGALSVGASLLNRHVKMRYSSEGTPSIGYLKPEIACFASNGTSFSAPIITGLAATIMEADSTLSAQQIKAIIEKSGHLYPYGNNYIGYGVPSAERILQLLENQDADNDINVSAAKRRLKLKLDRNNPLVSIYQKNQLNEVQEFSSRKVKGRKLKVKQLDSCISTTVIIGDEVFEILWDK
ncbi:MAG: subtilisin family serine protease [Cyclobacteriaceae bacterium]|jgi:subtilisin family serine protease